LALVAAQAGTKVELWARETAVIDSIRNTGQNAQFLPGVALPPEITPSADLTAAAGAPAVLVASPAQHLREMLATLAPVTRAETPLVICAKGIEKVTGKLVTEILRETVPHAVPAVLSGPSFAADVARGLPTAVTIAADLETARRLQATLSAPAFRPYASDDIIGVALGGAAKNVYAIACGTADGLGLGESARAALLARGFAELVRLGETLGARRDTLMGLAGLGDLVLTASSPTSRNFAFGQALGRGTPLGVLRAPGRPLAEGVDTAPSLVARARAQGVELPIAEATAAMLAGDLAPGEALVRLMSRSLKTE
jgi:glycerol-3-phosphate dehydrogenase (NAD(P)+)